MILGNFPFFKKILILPYQNYVSWKGSLRLKEYGTNMAIEIVQFIKKLFNMTETVFKYKKKVKILGNGDYYIGHKDKMNTVFDNIILTTGGVGILEKKIKGKGICLARYPNLIHIAPVGKVKKKRIIFLGGDFLRGEDGDPIVFIREINKYLNYLRGLYLGRYKLIYKLHPREDPEESKSLDLRGFKIIYDRRPAEVFFLENEKNIKSVFSLSSLASQSAYYSGIDSYLFFKLFPHDKVRQLAFKNLFSILPSECFMDNLSKPPKTIRWKRGVRAKIFQNVISQFVIPK